MYLSNLADFFTTIYALTKPQFYETNVNYYRLGPVGLFALKLLLPLAVGLGLYRFSNNFYVKIVYYTLTLATGTVFLYAAIHNSILLYQNL
jgi:hypothetical protein